MQPIVFFSVLIAFTILCAGLIGFIITFSGDKTGTLAAAGSSGGLLKSQSPLKVSFRLIGGLVVLFFVSVLAINYVQKGSSEFAKSQQQQIVPSLDITHSAQSSEDDVEAMDDSQTTPSIEDNLADSESEVQEGMAAAVSELNADAPIDEAGN